MKNPIDLIRELHRRSLWQVLGIYLVGSWLVLQVVDTLAGALNLPDWAPSLAMFLLIIGLPIVLATAFVQDSARPGGEAVGESETPDPVLDDEFGKRGGAFTWRNAIIGGVAAFAGWGIIAAGWLLLGGVPTGDEGEATGPVSSSVIVVLPFTVRGQGDLSYLGDGMVRLLATKLDGAGDLRSVDPGALRSHVLQDEPINGDPGRAEAVARRFEAGLFVLGDVVEAGGHLQLSATLYDTETGEAIVDAAVSGADTAAFTMVDELATRLLAGVEGGPGARVRQIAGVTTSSLPAFRAYLEGEEAFGRGTFDDAVAAFQRAVAEDSLYALAYYRLSVAAEWATRPEIAERAAADAGRLAHRLSERDQRMLEAAGAWRSGRYDEAERRYRSIVGTYPDDVEAWFQLGEILFHVNGLRGRPRAESEAPFRRVLSFVPDHAATIVHMVRLYARDRPRELDSTAAYFASLFPDSDRLAPLVSLWVYGTGRTEARDSLLAALAVAKDLAMAQATWEVGTYTRDIEGAMDIARLFTGPGFSPDVRTTGSGYIAHYLATLGRWTDADRELAGVAVFNPAESAEYLALLGTFPLAPVAESELRRRRDELERTGSESSPGSENPYMFFNINDEIHPLIRAYLAGLISVRLGELDRALDYATVLDSLPAAHGRGTLPTDLAASIRGAAALANGEPTVALAELESVRQETFYNVTMVSPYTNLARPRFDRAEALRELGRYEEAIPWYRHIAEATTYELPYLTASYYRLGQIHEELGNPAAARAAYAELLRLWEDADPELQPLVDEVRARVEVLSTD